jgi:hypothetical protein
MGFAHPCLDCLPSLSPRHPVDMSCKLFCLHVLRPTMHDPLTVSLAELRLMAVTPGLGHHVYASYGRLWWWGQRAALHGTLSPFSLRILDLLNTGRSRSVSMWSTERRRTTVLSGPTCLTNAPLYSRGTTRYWETSINLLLGCEVLKSISLALPPDLTPVAFFSHLPDHRPTSLRLHITHTLKKQRKTP